MRTQPVPVYQEYIGDGVINMIHIHPINDPMHRHIFFELVYVVNGTATHHLGDEITQLHAGDYFIIDTGSVHCYQDVDNFEIVNCLFLPEYIDRALSECPSLSLLLSNQALRFGVPVSIRAADRVFHDPDGTILRIIQTMEQEYAAQDMGYMELLRCHLTQVLVCLVRASRAAEQSYTPHKATAVVLEYLRTHFAEPLSLDVLSHRVGYIPQYVSTLFRKDTGMTLQEYQQKLRIEEACRLMSRKDLHMTDIALAVGYSDTKHFSRVFRRYKGFSPREYQKTVL